MGLGFARDTRGSRLIGMVENIAFKAKVKTLTANTTLKASDSGTVFVIGAADKTITLPATVKGVVYRFILAAAGLSTGAGLLISPNASDKITGNGLAGNDNKDLILAGSGDRAGDYVELVGDGDLGWYVTAANGTFTVEA